MEHAKKMILVEPRVLESMQQRQTEPSWDATTKNLKERDRAMKEILDDDRDTHDKANAYQQALWRFLNRFEQYKDRPLGRVEVSRPSEASTSSPREREGEEESGAVVERDVVASVPRSMRSKAERLLQRLKTDPEVKWNDLGELEYRGRVIKRSNLTDLVNDVLRKRRSVNDPQGWETFAQVLQRINVPQDLVGNAARWRYMQQQQTSTPQTPNTAFKRDVKKEEEEEEEEAAAAERFETPLKTTPTKWSKKEARSERKRQKRKSRKGLLWESM